MLRRIAAAIVLMCGCVIVRGQALADRVPADAIAYVGWAGSTALPGYENSHLKAVIGASDAPELINQTLPALLERMSGPNPREAERLRMALDLISAFWRHPSALYISGIDLAPPKHLRLRATVLCDAGEDAKTLVEKINAIRQQMPPSPDEPIEVGSAKDVVTVRFGPADTTSGALADVVAFKKDFTGSPAALAVYIDCDALLKSIDAMVQVAPGSPSEAEHWAKAKKGLGLSEAHQFAYAARFENGNWTAGAFLDAPEVRTGLLAAVANGSVSDDTLEMIPQSAVVASARKFSLAQFYDHIRQALGKIDPQAQLSFDRAFGMASLTAGINIKNDLIDSFGDDWAIYSSPKIAGSGALGTVLVNKLADPAKAQHALESLELSANSVIASKVRNPRMVFAFHTMEYHGLTIHYTPVLMISPAWAIDGDRLYVALYPQVITAADALAHSSKTSILDNPRFARLHKAMGEHFSAMHFVDTAAGIEGAYPAWMMLTHYLGLADMLGIHSPPMLLAPLPAIESQLNPAMSVSWWDKVGWHERSTTPFPGAGLLAGDSTSTLSVGGMALMASVFLPSLNRNREIANRIKCASNMRQIGQAILLYSNEHNGQFPSDLGTLIIDEDISPQVFFCPSAAAVPLPANFSTMVPEAQAAWLDQHSDYIYLGRGKTSSCDPGTIILYEKDSDHGGDGMNVLYGDGHVDFETLAAAHAEINRQRQNPALSK